MHNTSLSKEDRRTLVMKTFRVTEEEFFVSLKRLVSVTCLNEYFKYTFSKDLLDAKPKELKSLREDVLRYEEWRPKKKVTFQALVEAIDFILVNLK